MRLADQRHMTAKRKPKKAALVLTDDDRAVLSSLPDDKRAIGRRYDAATRRADGGRSTASFARNWDVRAGGRARAIG